MSKYEDILAWYDAWMADTAREITRIWEEIDRRHRAMTAKTKYVQVVYRDGDCFTFLVPPGDDAFPAPREGFVVSVTVTDDAGGQYSVRTPDTSGFVFAGDKLRIRQLPQMLQFKLTDWAGKPSEPEGAVCTRCNARNHYAEPSNTYVCWECR